jgi:Transmembrane secretion effector
VRIAPAPRVLRLRSFRIFYIGQTISAVGSAMSFLAITFAILRIGGSATDLGVVLGVGTLPALVLMLLGGVAGDRWERRRILLIADLASFFCQGALAVLLLSGNAEIWHFLVVSLVDGAVMAFSAPAAVGLMPSLVDSSDLQQANSLLGMSRNTAGIVGPPIAGVLIAVASPGWALAVDAASFLASALFLGRLPRSVGSVSAGKSLWGDIAQGWHEFSSRTWVWLMVLSFATYQATVLPAIYVLGPVLAERDFSGASTWAVVLSARAVGALAAGAVLLRWRPRLPLVVSAALVLLDIPFLLALAVGFPVAVVIVGAVISSAGVIGADTLWESTLQERVSPDVLSRVSSYDWFGSIAINPLGFALIGGISGVLGAGPVLFGTLSILVVVHVGLIMTPAIRSIKRLPPVAQGRTS